MQKNKHSKNCGCPNNLKESILPYMEIEVDVKDLVKLETLAPGTSFLCPWNGKIFVLQGITPSAAWVIVTEEREIERKSNKTGEIKKIIQKVTRNVPWSRGTSVKPL